MCKSYYLKQRVARVIYGEKVPLMVYADWWRQVEKYILTFDDYPTFNVEVEFQVKKDVSKVKSGLRILDDTQKSKLVVVFAHERKLKFITDADEFVLPNSETPNGSISAVGFFMSNVNGDDSVLFEKINLKNVNTSKMTSMENLFYGCIEVESINLLCVSTINVTNMKAMFAFCTKLRKIQNMNFDTRKVITMNSMFRSCKFLVSVNVSKWDISNVIDMSSMFLRCSYLWKIVGIENWVYNDDVERCEDLGDGIVINFLCECDRLHLENSISYLYKKKYLKTIGYTTDFKLIEDSIFKNDFKYIEKKHFDAQNIVLNVDNPEWCWTWSYRQHDVETNRKISFGNTMDEVFEAYEKKNVKKYDIKKDYVYRTLFNVFNENSFIIKNEIVSFCDYVMHNDVTNSYCFIRFYFNKNDKVILFAYFSIKSVDLVEAITKYDFAVDYSHVTNDAS